MFFFANHLFVPDEKGDLTFQADAIQDLSSSAASLGDPSGDLGITFVKMFLTFGALIALMLGTYWFLRRFIQQRRLHGSSGQSIHVVEKKMISAKTMLYLIEVDHKKILLAESQLEVRRLDSSTKLKTPLEIGDLNRDDPGIQ